MMMARHIPERGPKNNVTNSAFCPIMSPKGKSDPMGKYNTAAMKHTKPMSAIIPYIAILVMFSTPFPKPPPLLFHVGDVSEEIKG